jgi:hypothetical protein
MAPCATHVDGGISLDDVTDEVARDALHLAAQPRDHACGPARRGPGTEAGLSQGAGRPAGSSAACGTATAACGTAAAACGTAAAACGTGSSEAYGRTPGQQPAARAAARTPPQRGQPGCGAMAHAGRQRGAPGGAKVTPGCWPVPISRLECLAGARVHARARGWGRRLLACVASTRGACCGCCISEPQ